jgi:hypothetical protein
VVSKDPTAEYVLARLRDLDNYPHEALAPYEEFRMGANTYYFTPGGFLYRKDPGSLTDEVWHYRTDDGKTRPPFENPSQGHK